MNSFATNLSQFGGNRVREIARKSVNARPHQKVRFGVHCSAE